MIYTNQFVKEMPVHCPCDRMVPAAMTTPPNLIDLSHTVAHGLVTYKGLPAPIICDYLSREAGPA